MIATIAFGLLIVAAAVQIAYLLRKERKIDGFSHYILLAAAALLLAVTIDRSIRIRFVAVTNTFESLVFFSAVIALLLFIYRLRAKEKTIAFIIFGGTIVAIAFLAVASSPIAPKDVVPPIPALQSYWLVLHVTLSFIGESFFVVAFICAIYYLVSRDEERRKRLDRLTYTTIAIGYPIFTAGALIFGAVWAQNAWGAYWSWDPKETWALITWLVYTAYLHTRFVKRFRGRISAVLAIVGFAFTLFTFFGVNYLLAGLHSYA
ncbi:MAG: cytochrome c biogenesis protein CcsA [Spirochaetaceae bacterium]|nr:MAG: cytochrome c biogenesis protein CcsA [Spirochaetaceae bacterium]